MSKHLVKTMEARLADAEAERDRYRKALTEIACHRVAEVETYRFAAEALAEPTNPLVRKDT